ncbi:MAG: hypothetical protein KDA71_25755, partial [Planctomycetales bacterium]|nr:hypothetical protein [Planctomycetales bacterium]
TLTDGRQPCELVVDVDADVGAMTLSLPVLPGEATRENYTVPFRLAQRDRRLKVLYMEGTQGAEYRWLRDALQEDTDIRCVSMTVNDQYASRPTLQRVEDPYRGFPATRDELFEFDVVICSDISQQAFTQEQIAWTVDLVANRGGGFVMVGGHTSFGSGGWDRTAWEQLIPFDMSGQRQYVGDTFHVVIPADAESHPIWQLLDDSAQNRQALDRMPAFLGTNLIARVKPAATLLGETDHSLPQIGDVMPVFAAQPFGRGRTFAMSTDTTVYWGRDFESQWGEGDNRYFRKFWRNVVRWLAENSLSADRRLHVQTDKVIYTPGQPIQLSVEAYDEALQPTTEYRVTAQLIRAQTDSAPAETNETAAATSSTAFSTMLVASDSLRRYIGELPARLPTDQRDAARISQPIELLVTAYDGDQQIAAKTVRLHLLHDSKEWLDPLSRPEVLDEIAAASGGRRLSGPREFTDLLGSFDPTPGEVLFHNVPLWDSPLLWTLLVVLLALEWITRRLSQFHRADTAVAQT